MRILVTGGAGFIGSHVIRQLCKAGHTVLNVDVLTYAGCLDTLADLDAQLHRHVRRDIADLDQMRADFDSFQPDRVIHLAAESHVDRSIDSAAPFIRTNIVGTYNLLEAARAYFDHLPDKRRESFRFLHVSTDEVYGSLPETGTFNELSRYDPHSPYAASKAASDHLVRAWGTTYGLPVLVTHCSNNYGPYQFPEKLIPVVILKSLRGERIPVYGLGDNVRDWLHVEDHARALALVLEHGRSGETYNIGGNNEWRNIDLVRLLCRTLDEIHPRKSGAYEDLIEFVTDRPGHDRRYAIDSSKLRDEIGWQPRCEGAGGFKSTVQWYLDHRDWWQPALDGNQPIERRGAASQLANLTTTSTIC